MRLIFATLTAWMVLSCTAIAGELWPKTWQSAHHRDNALVGKLFNGKGEPVNLEAFKQSLGNRRYILIGEQHDNGDHHHLQAALIRIIAKGSRQPAVAFEMVPFGLQEELDRVDLAKDPKLDDLASRLKWEERGWYTWDIYRPVVLAAVENRLKLRAANLDRKTVRELAGKGSSSTDNDFARRYGLEKPLPEAARKGLDRQLAASHCGLLPKTAIPGMALVQRARDGAMARAMIESGPDGAILIAGNGHVRKDRGVPHVLNTMLGGRDKTVGAGRNQGLSIALMEVLPGAERAKDYALLDDSGRPLYDFVLFTPKANITDHCAQMRKRFKKSAPKTGN